MLAVAEGVGGTPAGREASNAAVQTLCRVLGEQNSEETRLRPAILDAVEEANKTVLEIARGAATTPACNASRQASEGTNGRAVGPRYAPSRCSS